MNSQFAIISRSVHPKPARLLSWMMRRWIWIVLVVSALSGAIFWHLSVAVPAFSKGDPRFESGDPIRGKSIFHAGDCASCHATPGQADRLQLGGGLALASPFGTFRVPNISQHPTDGIGDWVGSDLANALISGVSPQAQHYYPAFPYVAYTGMRLEDVRDLYAYLQTLPVVAGKPPPHDLPLIFRFRRALAAWKWLFFEEGNTKAALNGDPVHDRGAYLVESVAHCAECHSTRNVLGAIKPSARFAGGLDPEGTGFVPNITPTRIGGWSEEDIVKMLETGETPEHGRVGSSMADVVSNIKELSDADRLAIARYIKSLPPRPTPEP
jgi:mono/diheme cytochrome c family protein